MRILVTGGTGFTGAALVRRLLDDGHDVVTVDKQPGLVDDELRNLGADIRYGSITDEALMAEATHGCEVVFHVAAAFREIGVPDSLYHDVNVEGTRIVARQAKASGARKIIYCSTQGVHGHINNPPGDESSPIEPEDYYQQTKYEGELALRDVCRDGPEFTIIRPTAIYGPGDPGRFVMIFRRAKQGRFPIFGDGRTYYHPLYIDNLVDAFVLTMQPGVGVGEAYIIGDDAYITIEDLVKLAGKAIGTEVKTPHLPLFPLIVAGHVCEKVCKPFGINPPIFPRRVDWFRQVRAFRIDKAKRDLGYQPKIELEEGLRRTGAWYREHGYI